MDDGSKLLSDDMGLILSLQLAYQSISRSSRRQGDEVDECGSDRMKDKCERCLLEMISLCCDDMTCIQRPILGASTGYFGSMVRSMNSEPRLSDNLDRFVYMYRIGLLGR